MKRQNSLIQKVFVGSFVENTVRFNPYCLLRKCWVEYNTFQLILSFKKILIKRNYCLVHLTFLENFNHKTIYFNPYCLLRKFWSKSNTVQPIFSLLKMLIERQYKTIYDWSKSSKKATWLHPYRLLIKIFQKDCMDWTTLNCQ